MAARTRDLRWSNFLESYGSKAWDADNVQEGKAILDHMGTTTQRLLDTRDSLANIRNRLPQSISSTLIDIQNHKMPPNHTNRWIQNLECLFVKSTSNDSRNAMKSMEIDRSLLNVHGGHGYLAVSYTWDAAEGEATTCGQYCIQKRDRTGFGPTEIRDVVLHRAIKFAQYRACKYFWIDRECINQVDSHEKQLAIQSMDLVYRSSACPAALLSICIDDMEHLNVLAELLNGDFVIEGNRFKLRAGATYKTKVALKVLENITANRWWTRAWTFQEDYVAATRMTLLLPHTRDLEAQKIALGQFGTLDGELCVNSADFRTEATRFCLAYKNEPRTEYQGLKICDMILRRAAKYTILLEHYSADVADTICTPMSPLVFTDLASRGLDDRFEMLAIAANVCDYDVRLNTKQLQARGYSLSIALLALYLLNGEIITGVDNYGHQDSRSHLTDTMLQFLRNRSLRSFCPPVDQKLTFAKDCRFVDVELTKDGIRTKGHIWKLGKQVIVSPFYQSAREDYCPRGLTNFERQWLDRMAVELVSGRLQARYEPLARTIWKYLEEDATATKPNAAKDFKDCMARDIVDAMQSGKTIRLASIVDPQRPELSSSYSGLVIEDSCRDEQYLFTSWGEAGTFNSSNKHVLLGVNLRGCTQDGLPKLTTNKWVNGLFFFKNSESRPVVFPWPTSFTN